MSSRPRDHQTSELPSTSGSELEQLEASNMSYQPTNLAAEYLTVEGRDYPENRTCELTVHWKEDDEIGTLEVPSGSGLLITQGELRDEVQDQLATLTWDDDIANMTPAQGVTFYRALWFGYADATLGKVIMDISVNRIGQESEKQQIQVALPAGSRHSARSLANGLNIWLAEKGYQLESVARFRIDYSIAADDLRDTYTMRYPRRPAAQ